MKKILVSIFAVFYLTSTVGATLHLHYCMDKLVNWSLTDAERNKCENCGMEKDGGCCKDEHKFVKNTIDQNIAQSVVQSMQVLSTATLFSFIDASEDNFSTRVEKYPICHAPPLISPGQIYIHNCVFRI